MRTTAALPTGIGGIAVPQDDVSAATWRWAGRSLPGYLLTHSVRSYCWGAAIAAGEGWEFDRRLLWTAALIHDVGLTRLPRNTDLLRGGGRRDRSPVPRARRDAGRDAGRVARAIVLHMAPDVTLDDGVEAVLLDRATGLDVRGAGYDLVDAVRPAVVDAFPRGAFDPALPGGDVTRGGEPARLSERPAGQRGRPGPLDGVITLATGGERAAATPPRWYPR